ncbi:MAG: hypothetical protein RSA78_06840 [Oscillospiraceae bacterium]
MKAKKIICAIVVFALALCSFKAALSLEFIGGGVSLRYVQPLSSAQVKTAINYAETSKNNALSPTFWKESTQSAYANEKSVSVTAIQYLGSANAALAAKYISGTAPGSGDEYGCALSAKTANALFGSCDIQGIEVTLLQKKYCVRGVFESRDNVCIISADETVGFTAMDLLGTSSADRRREAMAFAMSCGMPMPYQAVFGESLAAIAGIICLFPLFAIGVRTLWRLWRQSRSLSSAKRQLLLFVFALIVSLMLPLFLRAVPSWLLPSKWSDFSFWSNLIEIIKSSINEWFSIKACYRDVQIKYFLLQTTLFTALQLPFCRVMYESHKL